MLHALVAYVLSPLVAVLAAIVLCGCAKRKKARQEPTVATELGDQHDEKRIQQISDVSLEQGVTNAGTASNENEKSSMLFDMPKSLALQSTTDRVPFPGASVRLAPLVNPAINVIPYGMQSVQSTSRPSISEPTTSTAIGAEFESSDTRYGTFQLSGLTADPFRSSRRNSFTVTEKDVSTLKLLGDYSFSKLMSDNATEMRSTTAKIDE